MTRAVTAMMLAAALLAVVPGSVAARQKRVTITSGSAFSPLNFDVNFGDHVVWVWQASGHTVTQGSSCIVPASPLFDTVTTRNVGTTFAWKSNTVATINYFCRPHCSFMTGVFRVLDGSDTKLSDFRITELHRTDAHDDDYIEIANLGEALGDLAGYRISIDGSDALSLPVTDIPVSADGRVVLHLGVAGSNDANDFFFPSTVLPAEGSAALYVPNTVQPSLDDATMIIDFVQWGAAGRPREATAVEAGLWTAGQFIESSPAAAIEFCGSTGQYGRSLWFGISTPNPGTAGNCATPTRPVTWGMIKAVHR